jgi:broad specificity phosphatase PhoE
MNVNYVFVRHGYGCHNAIKPLYEHGTINREDYNSFLGITSDPELTPLGVDMSVHNGLIISKLIKDNMNIETINVVGTSPLLRSMETAYYMTRDWENPPNKIYVFPFLREIDEHSNDKYSSKSRKYMEISPSYAMKPIKEQKKLLKKQGILQYFDFSFVEWNEKLRKEPGDIITFANWFSEHFISNLDSSLPMNVFIVTHAGVLRDYANQGFPNNSGFLLNTSIKNTVYGLKVKYHKMRSFNKILPPSFFHNYHHKSYNDKNIYCPSNRCGTLCSK